MVRRNLVAVGASAGGVEALRTLVMGLPEDFPAAILIVLHIPSHSPSMLHEILDRAGPLRAFSAQEGETIRGGRLYVAPSDRHMMVEGEKIRLTRGPKENRARPAIDVLFRSAAYASGNRVIGVVLSGMLDDGTAGLWAIKDCGGFAMVQSPQEAVYPSMPESALRHVDADAVLRLGDMPERLQLLCTEELEAAEGRAVRTSLKTEIAIALEGNGLQQGVLDLGPASLNTCPECNGILVQIREGTILRYRCHTGHAFSLNSLLDGIDEMIDNGLWNSIRALDERMLLLRKMGKLAQENGEPSESKRLSEEAKEAEQRVEKLRALVLQSRVPGHDPKMRSEGDPE